jgi:hypothetical protein
MCSMSWADHNCLYKLLNVLKDRVFYAKRNCSSLKSAQMICSKTDQWLCGFTVQVIITWGMIKVFMRMVRCGSKGITSWGISGVHFSTTPPTFQYFSVFVSSHFLKSFMISADFYHMLGGSQLSWRRSPISRLTSNATSGILLLQFGRCHCGWMLAEIMAGFFCYFLKCDRNFSTKIYLHKSCYAQVIDWACHYCTHCWGW